MNKTMKPYFTHASKSMGGNPEKFGLPSNKQISNSVYSRVSTRSTTIGSSDALSSRLASRKKSKKEVAMEAMGGIGNSPHKKINGNTKKRKG